MSNLRHEIDDIGRRIWPDTREAYAAMRARRRRWWVAFLAPRRPQPATRWLPVLAAAATAAIFLTLAGAHPAQERTEGQGRHAVQPTPRLSGPPEALSSAPPASGPRRIPLPGGPHAVIAGPPATQSPQNRGSSDVSSASPERAPATGGGSQVVTVVLTEADAGRTITVAPGTRIVVTLQAPSQQHRQWGAPRSLDSSILATAESARDAGGGAHGSFIATRTGRTRLVATQGGCHGPLCLISSSGTWQVRVIVR